MNKLKHFCRRVAPMLGAFADDALDKKDREQVEQHIRTCLSCAKEVKELQNTIATVQTIFPTEQEDPGEVFWKSFEKNVFRNYEAARKRQKFFQKILGAGVLIAACLLLLIVWPGEKEKTVPNSSIVKQTSRQTTKPPEHFSTYSNEEIYGLVFSVDPFALVENMQREELERLAIKLEEIR